MQEMMSHGLCHDVMFRNAGPVCQEYQPTLAQSSMIENSSKGDRTDDILP